jgi:adenylate cyclase
MPELVAKGAGQTRRWELTDQPVTLGRTAESQWQVPWDKMVSAVHATLTWKADRLLVQRRLLPKKTTNPVFYNATPVDEFSIGSGEEFVIGETTFRVVESVVSPTDLPAPVVELACGHEELRRHRYVDANERIEVLAALPGVIRTSAGEEELEARVVDVLMRGIPRAEAAIVVQLVGEDGSVKMCTSACHGKDISEIRPSRRLVREALLERKQSVMHVWQSAGHGGNAYTMMGGYDWAACTPLPDDPSPGWGLYLAGFMPEVRLGGPSRDDILKGDLKFAELVADVFGSLRQVSTLQRREGQLSRFLSRPVVAALAGRDIEATLMPREATVTVLFCDLRGSCAIAEDGQGDLMALWAQVNAALTIMSGSILEQDGVIGDFQGDAAMGFWGWPLEREDQVERAARAALSIRRQFASHRQEPDHPLARFACGIGIAHGPGIAGRLGTADQFKVDVFGPIVNLAARLESMTKRFGVAILIDEECARQLNAPGAAGGARCRRLARVRPYGFKRELAIFELMPAESEAGAGPESDRLMYDAALQAFQAGRWLEACKLLEPLPFDGAGGVLTDYIKAHPDGPPNEWSGVIAMEGK